jgi:hypothetical protein
MINGSFHRSVRILIEPLSAIAGRIVGVIWIILERIITICSNIDDIINSIIIISLAVICWLNSTVIFISVARAVIWIIESVVLIIEIIIIINVDLIPGYVGIIVWIILGIWVGIIVAGVSSSIIWMVTSVNIISIVNFIRIEGQVERLRTVARIGRALVLNFGIIVVHLMDNISIHGSVSIVVEILSAVSGRIVGVIWIILEIIVVISCESDIIIDRIIIISHAIIFWLHGVIIIFIAVAGIVKAIIESAVLVIKIIIVFNVDVLPGYKSIIVGIILFVWIGIIAAGISSWGRMNASFDIKKAVNVIIIEGQVESFSTVWAVVIEIIIIEIGVICSWAVIIIITIIIVGAILAGISGIIVIIIIRIILSGVAVVVVIIVAVIGDIVLLVLSIIVLVEVLVARQYKSIIIIIISSVWIGIIISVVWWRIVVLVEVDGGVCVVNLVIFIG